MDDFGWKFIDYGCLPNALSPVSVTEDLVDELLVVTKTAVAQMLHNGSVSTRRTRSSFAHSPSPARRIPRLRRTHLEGGSQTRHRAGVASGTLSKKVQDGCVLLDLLQSRNDITLKGAVVRTHGWLVPVG